jgi:betaine-aldehyde dehydrogenase
MTATDDTTSLADEDVNNGLALHWIDGAWVDSGDHRDSRDPATGKVIGRYSMGGASEAEKAIEAAQRAFIETSWRTDRKLRARVLNDMADRFEARSDEFVQLLGLENGKVRAHAEVEMSFAPTTLRFNAALALTDSGRASEPEGGALGIVLRQPAGVAGIIAPWNSPVALGLRSLAPALAAGTTVVMNLPYQTAQVNSLMAEIIAETDELPAGVVNIITGGHVSGDVLVRSKAVPLISFTGSTKTGRAISATAASNLKRLGLELGGKTPMIVFDDADLDVATPLIVAAMSVFAGQFCMTGSRVLVQSAIADRLRERLAKQFEAVTVGPASDPASEMGPMIDKANVSRVDQMVEDAIAAGARIITRGGPITEGTRADGAFYAPTLLEVSDPNMPIVQEEVFGPVVTFEVFESEEEAVALANNSEYGLSASVFSTSLDLPLRVAIALESGTVWVNDWAVLHDQFEEGGYKSSGQGRMRGLAVLEDFMEYKYIALSPGVTGAHQSP